MPCRYDGPEGPSEAEEYLSKVICLLDELEGGLAPTQRADRAWYGHHHKVKSAMPIRDQVVKSLCDRLKQTDVTKYSPEMQIWWRDHQIADQKREKEEAQKALEQKEIEVALSKLTPREQALLGVKPRQ